MLTSQIVMALVGCVLLTSVVRGQDLKEIVLWPDGAPGALGSAPKDIPTLTVFPSSTARPGGATIVIFPGGAYSHLAPHEGRDYALFLNQRGLTCFVLKYRLSTDGYHHPSMSQDAARAVRYVRANAEQFQIDPKRVGVMGSSAGGHLASTIMTHFDAGEPNASDPIERQSSRPDFGILCYPVITMGEFAHQGSKKGLIGENPSAELIKLMSNELQVTPQTPPCFIWHGLDDRTVPVENSLMFAEALKKNHVPFDLHIYQHAPHGQGLGDRTPPFAHPLPWTGDLVLWLKTIKILDAEPSTQPATRPAN
ncbi:MAG TPA: alpha/beta hydrolase [Tepidisphaeraceae bacterium]